MRAALILAAIALSSAALAREQDNPCPTCCAQLQRFIVEKKPVLSEGLRKEISLAIVAGSPGDPVAEWHCAHLLRQLGQGAAG